MKTKNLFYLLLAFPLLFAACNKSSNVDNAPTSYDVTLEAECLVAAYWGDEFTPGVDNYSVIIAENKFLMDVGGESLTEGSYYCLEIYAPITEDGNLPAGTYTLDMTESCAEWTIDGYYSALFISDGNGNLIPDEEGTPFSEATLQIAEDYAELTAVIEGKTHFVTFSGKFSHIDSTNDNGYFIHETTLTDDVVIESDTTLFVAEYGNDGVYVFVMENHDGNYGANDGAGFMLEIAYIEGSDSITGTYSVADGTLNIGTYDAYGMWGSWYYAIVDHAIGLEYAAIHDGSVTFVQEGENCSMTLDCSDVNGYSIKATMSGMIIPQIIEPDAMVKGLRR